MVKIVKVIESAWKILKLIAIFKGNEKLKDKIQEAEDKVK